ncbi:MAG: ligase-associated DNA damage response exonuclease [Saprospiraceae bacterium]|nr:ligase-associated DNA damage response exonuclease [Saprospiraceae bacterium]
MALIEFTKGGLYVPVADVYIDPWRRVKKALITHGHSDHARWGHKHYVCPESCENILKHRLGSIQVQSVVFGESIHVNGVAFTFYPAGHIVGSAQIKVEYQGEIWVVSGDYKVEDDGISGAFEPIPCHVFITESTFGLPVYTWLDQQIVFEEINQWWAANRANDITSILTGYTLGKAQRLLSGLDPSIGPIYTHGAIENMTEIVRETGVHLPNTIRITPDTPKNDLIGNLVLAPPSATGSPWMKRFKAVSIAAASGWMQLRGARRRRSVDRGFILSDHADWHGLNQAVEATGASKIFATHGYTDVFKRWMESKGLEADVVQTRFEGELAEINEGSTEKDDD